MNRRFISLCDITLTHRLNVDFCFSHLNDQDWKQGGPDITHFNLKLQ